MEIQVHSIRPIDDLGICRIHRDCEDPWRDLEECRAWLNRRAERGFYLQAAARNGRVVGHGEWIVSDEPGGRFLYLGMMQVDEDFQRMGVGRAMLDDGLRYARAQRCARVVTIPDDETGSRAFYQKCGFQIGREIRRCLRATEDAPAVAPHEIAEPPFEAIAKLPFVFGLSQACSRHMWEVVNRRPSTDVDRRTPAIALPGGGYGQLSYFPGNERGLALCWHIDPGKGEIDALLSLARAHGLKALEFPFFPAFGRLFELHPIETQMVEMVFELTP